MSLSYAIQSPVVVFGSKTTANVVTGAALTATYYANIKTLPSFEGMSKIELYGKYVPGTSETANSLQIRIDGGPDGTNYGRFLNDSSSGGTSTLAAREFTITQYTTDGTLGYDAQTVNFTVGLLVTGGTSAATGIITADSDAGATGTLTLSNVSGTFQDNEALTDSGTGSATVNGILQSVTEFTLPIDISTPFMRIMVKETGKASNFGTLYMEAMASGR